MDNSYATVINPKTGRFIKSGGKLHKRLIKDGVMKNTIRITSRRKAPGFKKNKISEEEDELPEKIKKLSIKKKKYYYSDSSDSESSSEEEPTPRRRRRRKS